jgi:hypothetical protein
MAKGLKNYSSKIPMLMFLLGLLVFLGAIYFILDAMNKNKENKTESLTMRPTIKMTKDKIKTMPKKFVNSAKRNMRNGYNKIKKSLVG